MEQSPQKRLFLHLEKHVTLYLTSLAILSSLLIPFLFRIYFRLDDTTFLEWVQNARTPLDSFDLSTGILGGMFRPMQYLVWWSLYHLFGLNALPYQIILTLFFALSMVFYFKLVELAFSKSVALMTLIAYFAVFFYLCHIIFWFADSTFVIEILFMNLSLYLILRAIRKNGGILWGVFFYFCAMLSKEPAVIIIPVVSLVFVITEWRRMTTSNRKRSVAILLALAALGLVWILLTPFVHGRLEGGPGPGLSGLAIMALPKWRFYSGILLSDLGILIWISSVYLALKYALSGDASPGIKRMGFLLLLSVGLSLVSEQFQDFALLILFASFVPILIKRRDESFGVVWFAVPLSGIMVSSYMFRTYLAEASFGIAIVIGLVSHEIIVSIRPVVRRLPHKFVTFFMLGAGVVVCAGIWTARPLIMTKFEALRIISGASQNMESMIEYISKNYAEEPVTLVIVNYDDMGIRPDEDLPHMDDLEKARRKKTLSSVDMRRLLKVAGNENVVACGLSTFLEHEEFKEGLLLVMNNFEKDFIEQSGLNTKSIYKAETFGEGSVLYELVK